jgi:hypothetical protein
MTGLAVPGLLVFFVHRRRSIRWDFVVLLGLSLVAIWGVALLRGANDLINGGGVLPWARYAFPAIIPSALMLCIGWWQVLSCLALSLRFGPATMRNLFVAFAAGLDVLALLSTWTYFAWKQGQADTVLWIFCLVALFLILEALTKRMATEGPP